VMVRDLFGEGARSSGSACFQTGFDSRGAGALLSGKKILRLHDDFERSGRRNRRLHVRIGGDLGGHVVGHLVEVSPVERGIPPMADRVATVYAGEIIEIGDVRTIFNRPYHPYTIGLIKAVPTLTGDNSKLVSVPGSPPDLIDLPTGCKFHPRCPLADDRCRREETKLTEVESGHKVACWHWPNAREVLKTFQV